MSKLWKDELVNATEVSVMAKKKTKAPAKAAKKKK